MKLFYTHSYNIEDKDGRFGSECGGLSQSRRFLGAAVSKYREMCGGSGGGNPSGVEAAAGLEAVALLPGAEPASEAAEILVGESGKPYIEDWDCFSVSHSGRTWAVLFAESECGLDIEYPRDCDEAAIAKRFFHPEDVQLLGERHGVPGQEGGTGRALFFRLWTRREALIKACGASVVNSSLPPVGGDLLNSDGGSKSTDGGARKEDYGEAVIVELSGRRWKIKDIVIPGAEEASAALCIELKE